MMKIRYKVRREVDSYGNIVVRFSIKPRKYLDLFTDRLINCDYWNIKRSKNLDYLEVGFYVVFNPKDENLIEDIKHLESTVDYIAKEISKYITESKNMIKQLKKSK